MRWFRFSVVVLANVLALGVVSNDVMAQRPGGGGGGQGGGRGFGGGMMMMGRGGFGGGGALALLNIEEVQKELKLTDEQKKTITDENTKMREAGREMFAGFQPGGGPPSDEDRKKMEEGQKKMADMGKAFEKQLESLLDPDQQDRLVGLMLQRSGPRAISASEMVAAALAVTDEQKTKLADAEKQNAEEMTKAFEELGFGGGFGGGGQDLSEEERNARREKRTKKMEELNKSAEERLLAVLNDDQKSKVETLKGPKFEFPAPQFGGGFGGPGGGGRGGRPGGGGGRPGGGN